MGVGSAGAMVDVSSYVEFTSPVARSFGRQDEFRDTSPGTFSFTLNNYDGRFTPGNLSSPLATTVSEGMTVSWLLGTRLLVGSIQSIQPVFQGDQSAWAQIVITCDDMLGAASRTDLPTVEDGILNAATLYALWPMDESQGSTVAQERTSSGMGAMTLTRYSPNPATPTPLLFGAGAVGGLATTQLRVEASAEILYLATQVTAPNFPYPLTSMGCWGMWVRAATYTQMIALFSYAGLSNYVELQWVQNPVQSVVSLSLGSGSVINYSVPQTQQGVSHYLAFSLATSVSAGVWTIAGTLYVDGVARGSGTYAQGGSVTSLLVGDRQPANVTIALGDGSVDTFTTISRLSHTLTLAHEELVSLPTEASILSAVAAGVPDLTLDALPNDLSVSQVAPAERGGTALDVINAVMRTEQGYAWSAGSGTLLAPVETVEIRARNRPTVPVASFDAESELESAPAFVRDITNMVSSVNVTSSAGSLTVTDSTVFPRVGSASASETVLLSYDSDLQVWGQDRLNRGENVNLRVASVTVDALTTPTDRSSSLLSLRLGDRVRVTNLPTAQLGFNTWDGWLLGMTENHTVGGHKFTLFFAPVINQTPAYFDSGRFMDVGIDQAQADVGSLYNSGSLSSSATSMTVRQLGPTSKPNLERSNMGYTLQVDLEQVTVTAAAAVSGGSQVLTVTRGANGTTAATHANLAKVSLGEVAGTTLRINYVTNPKVGVDLTGYTGSVGTGGAATLSRVSGTGPVGVGNTYARVTWTTASSNTGGINFGGLGGFNVSAIAGTAQTFAAWMRSSLSTSLGRVIVVFLDAAGVQIGSSVQSSNTSVSGSWVQASVPVTIPTNAVWCQLATRSGIPMTVASTWDSTGFMLGDGGTYFDGDTTGYAWDGVADLSASVGGGDPSVSRFIF
jgi:hypothetical protein